MTALVTAEGASILASWLAASRDALLVVDRLLAIRWINDRARKLIGAHDDLAEHDGALWLSQPDEQAKLTQTLAGLAKAQAASAVLFPDARARSVSVEATLLQVDRDAEPLFGLKLHWLRRRPQVDLALLGSIHKLTREEQATVGHIVQGLTVTDIAGHTGKAPSTVRTHVKRVYAKMGVTSREALLTECSAFFSPRV